MRWSLLLVGFSLVIVLFISESQSQFVRRRRKKLVVPPENNSPGLYPERRGKNYSSYLVIWWFQKFLSVEDNGFVRRVFRKKKVLPTTATGDEIGAVRHQRPTPSSPAWRAPVPMSSTSTLRPLIRKKIIKPFIPEHIPTTSSLPVLMPTEQNALNRSQDDPRCKFILTSKHILQVYK